MLQLLANNAVSAYEYFPPIFEEIAEVRVVVVGKEFTMATGAAPHFAPHLNRRID